MLWRWRRGKYPDAYTGACPRADTDAYADSNAHSDPYADTDAYPNPDEL